MKKFLLLIIILAIGGFLYFNKKVEAPVDANMISYKNSKLGISFSYPKILNASTTNESTVLHHDIPYKNTGECDMMGDTETYERLTDFRVTFKIFNKNLVDTMKEVSPYIPQENFVDGVVVESPGFIDVYKIGNLSGYAIYEGAEGCGQTSYYFPIETSKTILITKASIQVLSGVISKELENEVLAVPGVISREQSKEIFEGILETLRVN